MLVGPHVRHRDGRTGDAQADVEHSVVSGVYRTRIRTARLYSNVALDWPVGSLPTPPRRPIPQRVRPRAFQGVGQNATLPIFGQPESRNGAIPAMSVDRLDMKDRAAGTRSYPEYTDLMA